jgi:hypothetical protein
MIVASGSGGCRDRRSRRRGACRRPATRQQIRQVIYARAAGEARQDVSEVGLRIDASEPARAEDRVGDRGAVAVGVGTRE